MLAAHHGLGILHIGAIATHLGGRAAARRRLVRATRDEPGAYQHGHDDDEPEENLAHKQPL